MKPEKQLPLSGICLIWFSKSVHVRLLGTRKATAVGRLCAPLPRVQLRRALLLPKGLRTRFLYPKENKLFSFAALTNPLSQLGDSPAHLKNYFYPCRGGSAAHRLAGTLTCGLRRIITPRWSVVI